MKTFVNYTLMDNPFSRRLFCTLTPILCKLDTEDKLLKERLQLPFCNYCEFFHHFRNSKQVKSRK